MMLPTPSTSHVNYNHIYEPAEDSYLLLDTLSSTTEHEFLSAQFPQDSASPLVLEVGTGSGVVLAFLTAHAQSIFGRHDIAAVGVDVNRFASTSTAQTVQVAVETAKKGHATLLDTLVGDLACSMRPNCVDLLVFNPPYVPTEALPTPRNHADDEKLSLDSSAEFDRDSHLLSLSYAGGIDGMETTNRLLAQIRDTLSDRGVAYVLLCAQNKPDQVAASICAWQGGWVAQKVRWSGKTAGWEKLCVLRIWRERQEANTRS